MAGGEAEKRGGVSARDDKKMAYVENFMFISDRLSGW